MSPSALAMPPANDADLAAATPDQVEALKASLLQLIEQAPSPDIQVEASRFMTCIAEPRRGLDKVDAALIETGIAALAAKSGNVPVAKFVRNRLEIKQRNQKSGVVPWLSRKLGDSAVYAMLVGVVFSALLWAVAFGVLLTAGTVWNMQMGTDFIFPPAEAKPLAFAALVGGLVSVLTRVNHFADLYIFDPLLVFVNSLLKPLIGTVLALTAYAILRAGIIEVKSISFDYASGPRFVFWAFGFIAGFSERLAGDFIARAEGVIGGASEKTEVKK